MKQFFATGVLSGAANCRLHFFSCLTLKQEAMDAIRSETSDLPITLTHVPESTLIDTLCALPIKDAFSTTACDRKWLHAGFSATHLPAVLEDDGPLPTLLSLPSLKSRFPRLRNSVRAHVEGDWLPAHGVSFRVAGALVRTLVVRLSEGVSEPELAFMLKSCSNLHRFELTDYDLVGGDITGEFLQYLPACLKELRLCLLRSLKDANLKLSVEVAPHLQSISLEGNDDLTSDGMSVLARLRLKELALVCTRAGASPQIKEETLTQILAGNLQRLEDAAGAGELRPLRSVLVGELQALEISERAGPPLDLVEGGERFMHALGKHPLLRSLSLSGVVGLGDKALRVLANACPGLKALTLYRPGSQLTSAGLQQALEGFGLESLSLGCVADFSGAFRAVQCAGHHLAMLDMTRYFRSAAGVSLVSVLRQLQNSERFPCLRNAFFRGTFSAEQVAACRLTMALQPDQDQQSLEVRWFQLDEQTFQVQWQSGNDRVCVHLQRCFREGEFIWWHFMHLFGCRHWITSTIDHIRSHLRDVGLHPEASWQHRCFNFASSSALGCSYVTWATCYLKFNWDGPMRIRSNLTHPTSLIAAPDHVFSPGASKMGAVGPVRFHWRACRLVNAEWLNMQNWQKGVGDTAEL